MVFDSYLVKGTMKRKRIIARLDVKGPNVIKGVNLECLRIMGKPRDLARKYYSDGIDELIYMDIVASLYQRNNLVEIVEEASKDIFVPLTVGGGVRSLEDMEKLLRAGADKIAMNTEAVKNPQLITDGAREYGSQCIVVSIEAKKQPNGMWEAYTDNGRNDSGLDVVEWAKRVVDLGAGEILLTSVDKEGAESGYDVELINKVVSVVPVPVIASGGAGCLSHLKDCIRKCDVDAIAIASLLHYNKMTVSAIKKGLSESGIKVRLDYA